MWSFWLVFYDCGFHPFCPLMDVDKRLVQASWWERLAVGTTVLIWWPGLCSGSFLIMAGLYSIIGSFLIYLISFLLIIVLVVCSFSCGSFNGWSLWQECEPWWSLAHCSWLRSLPSRGWAHGLSEMPPPAARPHHRRDPGTACQRDVGKRNM